MEIEEGAFFGRGEKIKPVGPFTRSGGGPLSEVQVG
jgi:hypothetical protein